MKLNQKTLQQIKSLLIFKINIAKYYLNTKNIYRVVKLNTGYTGQLLFHKTQFITTDVNALLKTHLAQISADSRSILFESFCRKFGFWVDEIIELISVYSIFLENTFNMTPSSNVEFIKGELKIREKNPFSEFWKTM